MKYTTDQDGKSKTASAVDQEHYPEQNEVKSSPPAHKEIPEKSQEKDWLEGEAQINAAKESHNVTNSMKRKGGSVQHE
jgi:hypothetical protein